MPTNKLCTRRRVLGVAGSAAVAGLAGCTGSGVGGAAEDAESTATAEEDHQDGGTATEHHDDEGGHNEEGGHDETETESGHHDEEDGHGHDETVGEPTETAEVAMLSTDDGEHFEPHVVRVTVGGTVTFVNESGSHSTAAYHPDNDQPQLVPDGAASWDSGLLSESGATFEHTFETEGVYHYYCAPHETMGMIGSVIVGEPDAHDQPALEDPPESKPEAVRTKIAELNEMCNEALGHTH
ncbi:plastocyanin/azurin family copper-binding protein [Halobellus ordinarius]|uniref:plastocyanin/azurin family copper-binding protein n=1 Tax=Halobellus ordinarius TaxID=3075120 RepID=UPI0028805E19|nr:plastocyanin/azurin family copper-binding protein [Halobellus sp. ZY16]